MKSTLLRAWRVSHVVVVPAIVIGTSRAEMYRLQLTVYPSTLTTTSATTIEVARPAMQSSAADAVPRPRRAKAGSAWDQP